MEHALGRTRHGEEQRLLRRLRCADEDAAERHGDVERIDGGELARSERAGPAGELRGQLLDAPRPLDERVPGEREAEGEHAGSHGDARASESGRSRPPRREQRRLEEEAGRGDAEADDEQEQREDREGDGPRRAQEAEEGSHGATHSAPPAALPAPGK